MAHGSKGQSTRRGSSVALGAIDFNTIPVAFSFRVHFSFTAGMAIDTSFSEVSGLDWKAITEEVSEGGRMEKRTVVKEIQYKDLELKRGISTMMSPLALWCNSMILYPDTNSIKTATVIVNLLDAQGIPSRSWVFDRAYPIAWSIDKFSAMDNKLAIEAITLKHSGFMRIM